IRHRPRGERRARRRCIANRLSIAGQYILCDVDALSRGHSRADPTRRLHRMIRVVRLLHIALALVLLTGVAPQAALAATITLGDVPGTHGEWQQGEAIVPAPPEVVQGWLTDYAHWQGRFPDIAWARVLGDDERGRHIVEFHSVLAGRTFVVHEA